MNLIQKPWLRAALAVAALFANDIHANPQAQDKADFVFVIDRSDSMGPYIDGIRGGLGQFALDLQGESIDARFGLVVYGAPRIGTGQGAPGRTLLSLDFTSDANEFIAALQSITILSQSEGRMEAGLEAIRMALGATSVPLSGGDGVLDFRPDALKNIVLVTDENSDLPTHAANRATNASGAVQAGNVPNAPLPELWQAEVDLTARALIDAGAFVNMLIRTTGTGTKSATHQYGDWFADPDYKNPVAYDRASTLDNLRAAGLGESLQAQVLEAGLVGRTFDIRRTSGTGTPSCPSGPDYVSLFFEAKLEEVVNPCEGAASLSSYGAGTPNAAGVVPSLSFSAEPRQGATVQAVVTSSANHPTHGCLLVGTRSDSRPFYGVELLVGDHEAYPMNFPAAGASAVQLWEVPTGLDTCGMEYYVQAVLIDGGRVVATSGVLAIIGN